MSHSPVPWSVQLCRKTTRLKGPLCAVPLPWPVHVGQQGQSLSDACQWSALHGWAAVHGGKMPEVPSSGKEPSAFAHGSSLQLLGPAPCGPR